MLLLIRIDSEGVETVNIGQLFASEADEPEALRVSISKLKYREFFA